MGWRGAAGAVSWILFGLSALVAMATFNALWPVRRPWWLKLAELQRRVVRQRVAACMLLAGHGHRRGGARRAGSLDEPPAATLGVALSVASAVGLTVLAAAHRRAGQRRSTRRCGEAIGPRRSVTPDEDPTTCRPVPWSWRGLPWLAWFRRARR